MVSDKAAKRCEDYTYGKLKVGVVLFDAKGNILAETRSNSGC